MFKAVLYMQGTRPFTNEQTRDTGSIGQAKHRTKTNKTQKENIKKDELHGSHQ
jgi:hypothetical protein